jgi:hypothetical protein
MIISKREKTYYTIILYGWKINTHKLVLKFSNYQLEQSKKYLFKVTKTLISWNKRPWQVG